MNLCRVSIEEEAFDRRQSNRVVHYNASAQRADAIDLADKFLSKKVVSLRSEFGREYTLSDLSVNLYEHKLFENVICAQVAGNPNPMTDLIKRIAHRAAAIDLFGEDLANDLGFSV